MIASPRHRSVSTAAAVALALSLAACGAGGEDAPIEAQLLASLPTEMVLDVGVPNADAAQKPDAKVKSSAFYENTRKLGSDLNKLLKLVLKPIVKIAALPPKATAKKRRLWTVDDEEGRTLLAAEAHDDGHMTYSIAMQPPGGGAFTPVVTGSATPGPNGGSGAIWVDFDADVSPNTDGQLLVLYDFDEGDFDEVGPSRSISVYTYDLSLAALGDRRFGTNADGRTGVYHFQGTRAEGVLSYTAGEVDLSSDGLVTEPVVAKVLSRWNAAGGRTDAYMVFPPKSAYAANYVRARASHCWDRAAYARTFAETIVQRPDGSKAKLSSFGAVGTCVFDKAAPAVLPDLAPAPPLPTLPPEAG